MTTRTHHGGNLARAAAALAAALALFWAAPAFAHGAKGGGSHPIIVQIGPVTSTPDRKR